MRSRLGLGAAAASLVACGRLAAPGSRRCRLVRRYRRRTRSRACSTRARFWGSSPARAVRLGAGAPSLVASAQAIDNSWVGGFVDVPRDDCVLGYARGSSSIDDVDVAIYSEEGTTLAVDEGRDVHPTVLMCAPHPDRVYLAAHVVEGEGLVAVGAQLVPRTGPSSSRGRSALAGWPARVRARPTRGPASTTRSARIATSWAAHGRSFAASR